MAVRTTNEHGLDADKKKGGQQRDEGPRVSTIGREKHCSKEQQKPNEGKKLIYSKPELHVVAN
jgi:hypothetical protein